MISAGREFVDFTEPCYSWLQKKTSLTVTASSPPIFPASGSRWFRRSDGTDTLSIRWPRLCGVHPFRVAMQRPERVTAIVSQNGNAYEEGLGDAWQPIQRYWREPTLEHRNAIRAGLNLEGLRHEYSVGIPDPDLIKPEGYTLDAALLARPGNVDIQLDLFLDYANNVKLYPKFQEYFRSVQPPLLAVWGKFDPYFIPPGAEAFLRDNPNATVQFLETGHFALETHLVEVTSAMREFLHKALGDIS